MGTWNIPYDSVERAKRLRRRMSKPWIAKVTYKDGGYDFTFPDSDLIGDDFLYDELGDKAAKLKKDFDIRPVVKKILIKWMKEMYSTEEITSLQAVNITREVAGLKPLGSDKIVENNASVVKKKKSSQRAPKAKTDYRNAFMNYLVRKKIKVGYIASSVTIQTRSIDELKQFRLTKYAKAAENIVLFSLVVRKEEFEREFQKLKKIHSKKYPILDVRKSRMSGLNFIDVIVAVS